MFKVFKKNKWWFIIVCVVIFSYLGFLLFITFPILEFSIEKAGQLGDSFGIFNSLFSGLAFIALVITIYLQQQDMRDSKKELQKQNFETTFFNLIKIHNDLVANFREYNILEKEEKHFMYGYEAISFFLDKFIKGGISFNTVNKNLTKEENDEISRENRNLNPNVLKSNFETKLMRKNLKFIETVYSVLNLIDRATFLDEKDKKFYLETLSAQISDEELILIFYYTHSNHNDKKSLIEKYQFFKTLNTTLLNNWQEEIKLYKKEAFHTLLWQYFDFSPNKII